MEIYYDIRIPDNGPDFERLAKIVCERKYGMHFEPYGRNGQAQSGIDLFGDAFRICVQCKNYQGHDAGSRLLAGIEKDLRSAYGKFGEKMERYVLATTVPRDKRVQALIAELAEAYPIDIQVLFWEEFQEMMDACPDIIAEHRRGTDRTGRESAEPPLSCDFLRGRDDPNDVFVLPGHFIVPRLSLGALLDSAFTDSHVHAISGQRGMGKSELARCFARACCSDASGRAELRYHSVIWTTYSEKGLRDTIAKLDCSGDTVDHEQYSDKLRLLCAMEKPCLLVIDNYDKETDFAKELSGSSDVYQDLLRSGCHILFTSKVNLSSCYAVRQTEICPLPEGDLHALFWSLSEEEKTQENREKAAELIDKYLDRNTYLVILAAKLTATAPLDEILEAFRKLSVAGMTDSVLVEKDRIRQPPASLFDQYRTLFDLSFVQDDDHKTRLLYNLALLPIEGMRYRDFFSMFFSPEEQEPMKLAFSQLLDSFWVFLRRRYVCIHPLIREIIIDSVNRFDYAYIQQCVHALNERLLVENFTEHTCTDLKLAVSAYEVCKKLAVPELDKTVMISGIASTYDLIKNVEAAYDYSKQAMKRLEESPAPRSFDEGFAFASCCNMVGYAILHAYKKEDSQMIAEQALVTAKETADKLRIAEPEDILLFQLCTKILGNLAALYLRKKEYDTALRLHTTALEQRLWLVREAPSPVAKVLLAAAYKGIGTDYFYLSRGKEPQEALPLLQTSLENHALAVALYEEALSADSYEVSVANIRLVGTGLTIIAASSMELRSEDTQATIAAYIEKTRSAARCLASIEPVADEIRNCITNAKRLAEHLDSMGCDQVEHYRKLEETAELIFGISSEKRFKWIDIVSAVRRITLSHTQEENTYA